MLYMIIIIKKNEVNMTVKTVKTLECSQVLNLMDRDCSYQEALAMVMKSSCISQEELENELNNYI